VLLIERESLELILLLCTEPRFQMELIPVPRFVELV
jgi:hypothetical protein